MFRSLHMQSGAVLTMDNSRERPKLVVGDLIGVNVDGMVISPGCERMADGVDGWRGLLTGIMEPSEVEHVGFAQPRETSNAIMTEHVGFLLFFVDC